MARLCPPQRLYEAAHRGTVLPFRPRPELRRERPVGRRGFRTLDRLAQLAGYVRGLVADVRLVLGGRHG